MHQVWKYKLDHVAFWLITLLFYAYTRKDLIETYGWLYYLADVLIRNIFLAFACYLNIYFLFERFFKRNQYMIYIVALLGLLLLYTTFQNAFDVWLNGQTERDANRNNFFYNTYYNFSIGVFYIAFTLALELSKRWYKQQLLLHQVQTEKLETELKYLKAQLNPHFLFNCINAIYFQIDKTNSDARESLQKFSQLLRYQLYECNEDKIPIEKETSYLESYVDLQRLRKNSNYRIVFKTNEDVKDFYIAPLLLLPFVENAFKHLSNYTDRNNIIEMNMNRVNGDFLFSITNSVNPQTGNVNESGIGLKNVRRRLDLLYENRYKLDIQRTSSEFSVELKIQIP